MRVVIDSNVFISAFFWDGSPRRVLERAVRGNDELLVCREILDEIAVVLRRPKFGVDPVFIDYFLKSIEEIARPAPITQPVPLICRDPQDNKILACAAAGRAEFIVTGDDYLKLLG
ncbi:MAG: putative toxin-antitoxin system toxin component, PIN family [Acidobacteriota bacterium]|nr:putative toxin-antitoxin system toxin component, PIN family [Acidobacteriota bacterium]